MGSEPWVLFIGIKSFSLRAQVVWKAKKQDVLAHWMQAPWRISQMEHFWSKTL
jgi:hypothetical protein